MSDTWRFADTFDPVRRSRLTAMESFDSVITAIADSLSIVGGCVCEADDAGLENCRRPVVSFVVSAGVFDAFFNGAKGYRARFLESPEAGQAANSALLRTLEPVLTAAVLHDCGNERLSPSSVRKAFLANSAKVWPDESELDFLEATPDLAIPQWQSGCEHINAPLGANLWAPEGTSLLALGAFLDAFGNERVSHKKILRRFELHDCGFT